MTLHALRRVPCRPISVAIPLRPLPARPDPRPCGRQLASRPPPARQTVCSAKRQGATRFVGILHRSRAAHGARTPHFALGPPPCSSADSNAALIADVTARAGTGTRAPHGHRWSGARRRDRLDQAAVRGCHILYAGNFLTYLRSVHVPAERADGRPVHKPPAGALASTENRLRSAAIDDEATRLLGARPPCRVRPQRSSCEPWRFCADWLRRSRRTFVSPELLAAAARIRNGRTRGSGRDESPASAPSGRRSICLPAGFPRFLTAGEPARDNAGSRRGSPAAFSKRNGRRNGDAWAAHGWLAATAFGRLAASSPQHIVGLGQCDRLAGDAASPSIPSLRESRARHSSATRGRREIPIVVCGHIHSDAGGEPGVIFGLRLLLVPRTLAAISCDMLGCPWGPLEAPPSWIATGTPA